jgi:ribosomal protein L32E
MATNTADAERRLAELRDDMSAAASELKRRVPSYGRVRSWEEVAGRDKMVRAVLTAATATVAIGYAAYVGVSRRRERDEPQRLLLRRVRDLVGRPRGGLLLKLQPVGAGYSRVTKVKLDRHAR